MWNFHKNRSELQLFQLYLKSRLQDVFETTEVKEEWSSMQDEYNRELYSPRLDVAVGPFATHQQLGHVYDEMINKDLAKQFIRKLVDYNRENLERHDGFVNPTTFDDIWDLNYNSRCLIAIEIENQVSRKHLLDGVVNASALGRIGIVIPWSGEKLRAFVKLVRYLQYLKYADKNTFNTTNLLIVTKEQMHTAIEEVLEAENSNIDIVNIR